MDPALVRQLALGAIPPALVGIFVFGLAWWRSPQRRPSTDSRLDPQRSVAVVLGIATGLIAAGMHWLLFGWPPGLRTAEHWLLPIAVAAAASGGVAGWIGRTWFTAIITALVTLGAAWASARGLMARWSPGELAVHLATPAVLAGGMAAALAALAGRATAARWAAAALVAAAGASQLLVLGMASLKVGQVAGVMASWLGGALVAALWFGRRAGIGHGVPAAVTVMVAAALFQGAELGDGGPVTRGLVYGVLVALAAVFALMGAMTADRWNSRQPDRLAGRRALVAWVLIVGAAVVPVAVGLGLAAILRSDASGAPSGEYEY